MKENKISYDRDLSKVEGGDIYDSNIKSEKDIKILIVDGMHLVTVSYINVIFLYRCFIESKDVGHDSHTGD